MPSWLSNGTHVYRVTPLGPNRSRLDQSEDYGGLLGFCSRFLVDPEVFDEANQALKERAESMFAAAVSAKGK